MRRRRFCAGWVRKGIAGLPVVCQAVLERDAMLLEERMNLQARAVAEQAAQVGRGELVFAVRLEREGFEGRPFRMAGGGQEAGEGLGQVEGDGRQGSRVGQCGAATRVTVPGVPSLEEQRTVVPAPGTAGTLGTSARAC